MLKYTIICCSLIQRLAGLLQTFLYGREGKDEVRQREHDWQKQKVANVIFLLQVIRSLVSPQDSSQTNTHEAQKVIFQAGAGI